MRCGFRADGHPRIFGKRNKIREKHETRNTARQHDPKRSASPPAVRPLFLFKGRRRQKPVAAAPTHLVMGEIMMPSRKPDCRRARSLPLLRMLSSRAVLVRFVIFAALPATTWLQLSRSFPRERGMSIMRDPSSSLTIPTNSFDAVDANVVFHVVFTTSDETFSQLNLRCIESIFYFHPKALVQIHSNSVTGLQKIPDPLQPLLQRGLRIQLTRYTAEDVLQAALDFPESRVNATAARLWADNLDLFRTEKYWFSNESNLLRLCLLYAHGGIYLDTDVVLVAPLIEEPGVAEVPSSGKDGDKRSGRIHHRGLTVDNAMSRDGGSYDCAVMKFTKAGNHFLAAAIDNFFQNYNGTDWGNNGPRVFKRTAMAHPQLVCPSPSADLSVSETCWLNPLNRTTFQPVPWRQWPDYCFRGDTKRMAAKAKRILDANADVFAVHLNNQIIGELLERNLYREGSICDVVLHHFCVVCD